MGGVIGSKVDYLKQQVAARAQAAAEVAFRESAQRPAASRGWFPVGQRGGEQSGREMAAAFPILRRASSWTGRR